MLHILFFLYCLILCYSLLPSLLKNPVLLDSLLFDIKNNPYVKKYKKYTSRETEFKDNIKKFNQLLSVSQIPMYDKPHIKNAFEQAKNTAYFESNDEIEKIYTSMNKARQLLVTPIEPTWDQLLTKWYEEEYQGKEFKEGTPLILTEKGERVRSKSEKILADYFYRKNILYKYEKPLHLKGYGTVYPDFTFLSKKTYQEIYWEHEGMMDKQDYARAAVRKIELYQINHIYPGDRLIITFETEQNVLNSKIIENLIEKYLI